MLPLDAPPAALSSAPGLVRHAGLVRKQGSYCTAGTDYEVVLCGTETGRVCQVQGGCDVERFFTLGDPLDLKDWPGVETDKPTVPDYTRSFLRVWVPEAPCLVAVTSGLAILYVDLDALDAVAARFGLDSARLEAGLPEVRADAAVPRV